MAADEVPLIEFDPAAAGPLAGFRVLDLSRLVAGNMLSLQLGDFGAEVIKIEPPEGDPLRAWRDGGQQLFWKTYSRNKLSVVLNLRHARRDSGAAPPGRRRGCVHRELPAGHAGDDGAGAGRPAGAQSAADHRARLRLRPDRPLCAAARLRHPGRGDERVCRPHRLSRSRTGAAAAGAGRHDRRAVRRDGDGYRAARPRAQRGRWPGDRPVAAGADLLHSRTGSGDLPAHRGDQAADGQRLQHLGAAQPVSLRRWRLCRAVRLHPGHGQTHLRHHRPAGDDRGPAVSHQHRPRAQPRRWSTRSSAAGSPPGRATTPWPPCRRRA